MAKKLNVLVNDRTVELETEICDIERQLVFRQARLDKLKQQLADELKAAEKDGKSYCSQRWTLVRSSTHRRFVTNWRQLALDMGAQPALIEKYRRQANAKTTYQVIRRRRQHG